MPKFLIFSYLETHFSVTKVNVPISKNDSNIWSLEIVSYTYVVSGGCSIERSK